MPDRPRVFVTRALPGDAPERLAREADVNVWPDEMPPSPGELRAHVAGAHGIVCLLTDRIDAALLDAAPGLRVISNVAAGYDNVDVAAATARRIPVGNTPGVLTETTADLTFALILTVARRIVEAERYLREGRWRAWHPSLMLGHDVHAATLGIVGYGKIGRAVARRALGFGMRVLYTGRPSLLHTGTDVRPLHAVERGLGGEAPLEQLLRESDLVSLHVPLTSETRHMIGERELRMMKPSAYLINTARGPVVDQAALVRALQDGWIAGAGIDVMETEPLPPDDPLLGAPNVVMLPHIGSASRATRELMASMAVDNCLAGLRGNRPPHCVNPEVYE